MATQDQLDDLVNAAKLKVEAQKKEQEKGVENSSGEDIYASMKDELYNEDYQDTYDPEIKREAYYGEEEYDIEHTPSDESYYDDEYPVDPNDSPLFENGPGASQIELWKKQFSREQVFHTQILEKHFVFRTLNRYEYKQIVAIDNIDALHREEIICKTCVLWPFNYDFKTMAKEDGGYPSTLAQIIMENSGFTKEYGIEVL